MSDMRTVSSVVKKTILPAALSLLLLAGASAQKVSTDFDHTANFQQYRTFSIYKLQASDQLVEQRLRDDLTRDLTARGLQQVSQGGDLSITAIGTRGNQQEYNTFYDGLGGGGYGWGGRGFGRFGGGGFGGGFGGDGISDTRVINIPVGTLVVDVYDGAKHQLLFRGMASETLSSKEDKNSKKLQQSVDKIFAKYPTKGAA